MGIYTRTRTHTHTHTHTMARVPPLNQPRGSITPPWDDHKGYHGWCGACGIHGPGNLVKCDRYGRGWHRCSGRKTDGPNAIFSRAKCLERTRGVPHPIPEEVTTPPPHPDTLRAAELEAQLRSAHTSTQEALRISNEANAIMRLVRDQQRARALTSVHSIFRNRIKEELKKVMETLDDNMDKLPVGCAIDLANGLKRAYDKCS